MTSIIVSILLFSAIGAKKIPDKPNDVVLPQEVQNCLLELPPDPVTMQVVYELTSSEFITTLFGVPAGYDVSNGPYPGWCIDYRNPIPINTDILVKLYSSYCPPGHLEDDNWDLVNYLLNHKSAGADWYDIQTAIWGLINFGNPAPPPSDPLGQGMVANAIANGNDFVPGPGQIVAVICDPIERTEENQIQYTIIEVSLPSDGCTSTQGYWKNHPNDWPMETITIGDVTYSRADAIDILKTPVKKDMTIAMFYQLVAAKLNVASGADSSCIMDTIDDADDWMIEYGPVGSEVPANSYAWDIGEPIKDELEDYNQGKLCASHCDD